ncbi:MAG: hypothetical protein AAFN00_22130, partial [Cyanobacteria bacterium J06558_2]
DKDGNLHLDAFTSVKVADAVSVEGIDYSIYTGEDGSTSIVHQQLQRRLANSNSFLIGSIAQSGTIAEISGQYAFKDNEGFDPIGILIRAILGIIGGFSSPSSAPVRPKHVEDINPVTGKPYTYPLERELNEDLTTDQKKSLRGIINNQTYLERVKADQVYNNGRVDERGCFFLELNNGHLGDDRPGIVPKLAADYATHVSGSANDFLAITVLGIPAFYDGIVKSAGAGYSQVSPLLATGLYPSGIAVVETKFGYQWLNKYIDPQPQPGIPRPSYLSYDNTAPNSDQRTAYNRMKEEIKRHLAVARECGLLYFVSFNRQQAWAAGQELFAYTQTSVINESANVFRVPARGQVNP